MRENTPPRVPDFERNESEVPNDPYGSDDSGDEEFEMEEVTLEELERRLQENDESDDEDDGEFANEEDEEGAVGGRRTPVPDDAVVTFREHTEPVFSCALHPRFELAATGSQDDRVYVWSRQTGASIHVINEHKDTVTEVHWSHDGTYLATCDLAGELLVHKLQKVESSDTYTLRQVWRFAMGDMAWLRWHRGANVLLAGSDNGEIYIWRIPSGDCKILPGQGVRCEMGELTGDGKKLLTGYVNGVLKLWDLKTCAAIMVMDDQHETPDGQPEGVMTIACDKESPLYMSAGPDGAGKIVFSSNNGPVGMVTASGPVECVAFSPSSDLKLAASGTLNGYIEIWDSANYSLRTQCEHSDRSDGIIKIKWISDYTLLVSTFLGNIFAYDVRSGVRKFSLSGHMLHVYDYEYDERERILLSASEDCTAKVFKVPQLGD